MTVPSPTPPRDDDALGEALTANRWQDTSMEELLDTAQSLSIQTEECGCPGEPHQNALHDFAHDAARVLTEQGPVVARLVAAARADERERIATAIEDGCEHPWVDLESGVQRWLGGFCKCCAAAARIARSAP